jgi:alcohol dehydrogenase
LPITDWYATCALNIRLRTDPLPGKDEHQKINNSKVRNYGQDDEAAIFVEKGRIVLDDKPIPDIGPQDALIRVTTTTICGTDVHILKGEYPVAKGLTIGHEPLGIIEKLGSGVVGFKEGQRVIAGAITPSGWSHACLCGCGSQDGAGTKHGWKAIGGWKFGNTIDGCQAEFVCVPDCNGKSRTGR